jgi:acetyl esterase/lipase
MKAGETMSRRVAPIACKARRLAVAVARSGKTAAAFLALFAVQAARAADGGPQLTTIEYKQVAGETLRLDVCTPPAPAAGEKQALRPAVIVVHGGGWASGDRRTDFPPVLEALTAAGYLYVAVDYRLSPKHPWPACRDDVKDAVAWTKAHIRDHGGDPDRLAILGYSAGGHLAFWAAIQDQPPHPLKGLIGLAPATDLLEDLGRRGGPSDAMRQFMNCEPNEPFGNTLLRLHEASPINALHAGLPPILLIHGTEDRSVPFQQSFHIQRKIAEARWSVPCEIYRVEGAPHRQTEWDKFDPGYKTKLIAWLRAHL